ncbi:hypothetical protein [Flavobacterium sp.]|uniref:hypothetical protein n=1 Tax=Flavobacterium sp. TaxID=239 RepID=UPI002FDE66B8
MRKLLLLFTVGLATQLHAQIKLKINDKLVSENTVIKAEDIKKIEVGFDKYKPMEYYGLGRVFLFVELLNETGERKEKCYMIKEGTNAIKAFLDDKNVFYPLKSDVHPQTDFFGEMIRTDDEKIVTKLKYMGKYYNCKQVKLRISLYYRDKIGYEKYGDPVMMIKDQYFTIDNTVFYEQGQKEKEKEKVAEEARKAEDAKKAEEAQKAKEAEEKKGKGKKLVRSVLGF